LDLKNHIGLEKDFVNGDYYNLLKDHYKMLLIIKQGLRYYYGNFRLFFLKKIYDKIKKAKGKARLKEFILYLERSLFMILYRCNFVAHPKIAIYLIRDNHDIFYINGKFVHFILYQVQKGDFIGIKNRILRKMLNRFLRTKQIPSYLYVNYLLGFSWVLRLPEIRDYSSLNALPLSSIRYLIANLKLIM